MFCFRIVAKKVVTFVESMVRTVIEAKLKSNIARKDYFQHYLKKDTLGNYINNTHFILLLLLLLILLLSLLQYYCRSHLFLMPSPQEFLFLILGCSFQYRMDFDCLYMLDINVTHN